ncbi:MAG: hypothetical protein QF752_02215 [Planctomycetota bacterium]|jgi:hypothetical protein|nr:hypothetical protein [Planctomycetota bacterium]
MMALLWLVAFVWTLALELPVYAWGIPRNGRWILGTVFLLNLTTHPCLCFVAPKLLTFDGWIYVGEILVWITEGLLLTALLQDLRIQPFARNLILAGAANLFSYLIGTQLLKLLLG